jgi:hypothetical protein
MVLFMNDFHRKIGFLDTLVTKFKYFKILQRNSHLKFTKKFKKILINKKKLNLKI